MYSYKKLPNARINADGLYVSSAESVSVCDWGINFRNILDLGHLTYYDTFLVHLVEVYKKMLHAISSLYALLFPTLILFYAFPI